jgi:hypothetical protein
LELQLKGSYSAPGQVGRWLGLRPATLATLADELVVERADSLKRPEEAWSNGQIIENLLSLIEREQGLDPHHFNADSEFVEDMRMD